MGNAGQDFEVVLDSDAEMEAVPTQLVKGKAAGKKATKKPATAGRGAKASAFPAPCYLPSLNDWHASMAQHVFIWGVHCLVQRPSKEKGATAAAEVDGAEVAKRRDASDDELEKSAPKAGRVKALPLNQGLGTAFISMASSEIRRVLPF